MNILFAKRSRSAAAAALLGAAVSLAAAPIAWAQSGSSGRQTGQPGQSGQPGRLPNGRPIGPDSTRPGPPASRRPGAAGDPAGTRNTGTSPDNSVGSRRTITDVPPGSTSFGGGGTDVTSGAASGSVSGAIGRAAAFAQTARQRARSAPSSSRASYRQAATEFGAVARAGSAARQGSQTGGALTFSAAQSQADVRAMLVASLNARRAGRTRDASRYRTLATRYATGARAFFTGQLREILFSPSTGASRTLVIQGDSRAAARSRSSAASRTRSTGNGAALTTPAAGNNQSGGGQIFNGAGATPVPPTPVPAGGNPVTTPGTPPAGPIIQNDPGTTPDVIVTTPNAPIVVPGPATPAPAPGTPPAAPPPTNP